MTVQSVLISSVQKELAEERRAVKAFVEGDPLLRRYFTVFLFEDLPARDRRADEVYLREVDHCALYVGLFGQTYGFEDAAGISPTEREFDRATEQGKVRLIFVKGADDRGRHPKMQALIRKAGAQLIRRRRSTRASWTIWNGRACCALVRSMRRLVLAQRSLIFRRRSCASFSALPGTSEAMRWRNPLRFDRR